MMLLYNNFINLHIYNVFNTSNVVCFLNSKDENIENFKNKIYANNFLQEKHIKIFKLNKYNISCFANFKFNYLYANIVVIAITEILYFVNILKILQKMLFFFLYKGSFSNLLNSFDLFRLQCLVNDLLLVQFIVFKLLLTVFIFFIIFIISFIKVLYKC